MTMYRVQSGELDVALAAENEAEAARAALGRYLLPGQKVGVMVLVEGTDTEAVYLPTMKLIEEVTR